MYIISVSYIEPEELPVEEVEVTYQGVMLILGDDDRAIFNTHKDVVLDMEDAIDRVYDRGRQGDEGMLSSTVDNWIADVVGFVEGEYRGLRTIVRVVV